RKPVDPGGEHGLDGRRDLDRRERLRQPQRAALAGEDSGLDEGAHALLEEERVSLRAFDEQPLDWFERMIGADEGLEQGSGALGSQRLDPELGVVTLPLQACWYSGR